MQPVRLGIIGCGVIGSIHLKAAAAAEHIDVVAVADLRAEVRDAAAKQYGVGKAYETAEQMIADGDVEAVVLAMPANVRTALALKAFAAGKHVLTEKPVAMNAGEVRKLIAARGKLTGACCSSRFRTYESAKVATDFIASGKLGPLREVRISCVGAAGPAPKNPPPVWRLRTDLNAGGIMSNWGCYDLDYMLGVTSWKLKPVSAFAQTWQVAPALAARAAEGSNAETHVVALIRCDGGTVINIERGEFTSVKRDHAWEIIGEAGSLTLAMAVLPHRAILHHHADPETGVATETLWEGDEESFDQHTGPVTDFCAAIREQRPPRTSLENALVVQQITDAIYASAKCGESVKVG